MLQAKTHASATFVCDFFVARAKMKGARVEKVDPSRFRLKLNDGIPKRKPLLHETKEVPANTTLDKKKEPSSRFAARRTLFHV